MEYFREVSGKLHVKKTTLKGPFKCKEQTKQRVADANLTDVLLGSSTRGTKTTGSSKYKPTTRSTDRCRIHDNSALLHRMT